MEDPDELTIHLRSRSDKTYVGPSFPTLSGQRLRIANKYIDGGEAYEFATVKDEVVLRNTPAGRLQIKATFIEMIAHSAPLLFRNSLVVAGRANISPCYQPRSQRF
ncbi:hypothetical protein WHZ78_00935 [Bradyrhizobium symbiodeficiens]|uniref:hypothetical protein n=1 Tax=Bradyrhizobium symbiodeficiens TaxID=1404367 RepID=UPI0030CFADCC